MGDIENPIVTLEELAELAVRAFDAKQEKLAGCLYMIIESCSEMRLDELFGALVCFRRGDFAIEKKEDGEWRRIS